MKNLSLACLFLFLSTSIAAQIWEQVYQDTASFIQGFHAEQTPDGGYIFVGESDYPTGAVRHYIHLIKTDDQGIKEWGKTLNTGPFLSPGYREGRSIHVVNGGYLIGGSSHQMDISSSAMQLAQTYNNGDTIWTRKIVSAGHQTYGRSVLVDQNGDYVIAGKSVNNNSGIANILFAKINPNGEILWTKEYFNDGISRSDIQSIKATNDQGYILTGSLNNQLLVMKTDMQGDSLWSKSFGLSTSDQAYAIAATNDGGYIVGGSGSGFVGYFPVLLRLDAAGDKIWDNPNFSIGLGSISDLIIDDDQNIVVTGSTHNFGGGLAPHGFLAKLDMNGSEIWSNDFSTVQKNYQGSSVRQTTDGGYVVGGSSNLGMLLLKTNKAGVFNPTTSINHIDKIEHLQLRPNPARDFLEINMGQQAKGIFQVVLYDSKGIEICRELSQAQKGILHFQIRNLATAIYIVQIEQEGKLLGTGKVFIQ